MFDTLLLALVMGQAQQPAKTVDTRQYRQVQQKMTENTNRINDLTIQAAKIVSSNKEIVAVRPAPKKSTPRVSKVSQAAQGAPKVNCPFVRKRSVVYAARSIPLRTR